MLRAVAFAGVGAGRYIGGVGFQHDAVERQLPQHPVHAVRLRPGAGTAEAELETELDVLAGLLPAAAEGMHHTGPAQLVAFECGDHRCMGAAHVQQHRQIEVDRQLQLPFEQGLLAGVVRVVDVEIQADLADGAELRLAVQALQPVGEGCQVLVAVLLQEHRMQPQRGIDGVIGAGQAPDALPVVGMHAEHDEAFYTGGAAACQHLAAVGIEVFEVQVCVGVDQAHEGPR